MEMGRSLSFPGDGGSRGVGDLALLSKSGRTFASQSVAKQPGTSTSKRGPNYVGFTEDFDEKNPVGSSLRNRPAAGS
jgi:hypothetical protein